MDVDKETELEKIVQYTQLNTLGDILERTHARFPDKTAFTYGDLKVTYAELDNLVNQTANGWVDMSSLGANGQIRSTCLYRKLQYRSCTCIVCIQAARNPSRNGSC